MANITNLYITATNDINKLRINQFNYEFDTNPNDKLLISEYELNNLLVNKSMTIIFALNDSNGSIFWNCNNKRVVKIKIIQNGKSGNSKSQCQ